MDIPEPSDSRPTALSIIKGHNLDGKTVVITGGSEGIGLETTRALASAGAHVIIATRDLQAEMVAITLRKETGNPAIEAAFIDVNSLVNVHAFAEQFLARAIPLHLLINNAGIMARPLSFSPDGFESHFATNYLGHFALSNALLPALQVAGKARIITLTSIAHQRSDIHYLDLFFHHRPYDPWLAYGQSATATSLLAVALNDRLSAQGITAFTVMPGGIMTGLQQHIPREKQLELGWIDDDGNLSPVFKTPAQGAATTVWAAVSPELEGQGGLYLQNCAVAGPWSGDDPLVGYLPYAVNRDNAQRLWSMSEKLVALVTP